MLMALMGADPSLVETSQHTVPVQGADPVHQTGIHIALSAERIGQWAGIPITNTLITAIVVTFCILATSFFLGRSLRMVPGRMQLLVETTLEYITTYVRDTLENTHLARKLTPLLIGLFTFVFASNLLQFLPGFGSVGFHTPEGFTPLFRSVNTDLNVTLALAVIAVVAIQSMGVAALGFVKYTHKFINFSSPINFFIGIIDIISEVARLVSFSFRLFGNIFAGEVLILVIAFFVPYILPVPLILFEVFVGFVQAAVFALLTLTFAKIAIADHH
jgi:F-type H+-transporting ATPase subunit a